MSTTVTIDLRHVARGLGIPLRQVQAVVELLDDGNTVPFITRYRKDQTGGLDEEQIRRIQDRLTKARLLGERKQAILRSIESQGSLTETLAKRILSAGTVKRLEDLYLPHKPKKRTLATLARSRGLEPLAREILEAAPSCADLNARAADFVSPDRQVPTLADALLGAGHILAEQFSERPELRQRLREVLQRTGRIISTRLGPEPAPGAANDQSAAAQGQSSSARAEDSAPAQTHSVPQPAPGPETAPGPPQATDTTSPQPRPSPPEPSATDAQATPRPVADSRQAPGDSHATEHTPGNAAAAPPDPSTAPSGAGPGGEGQRETSRAVEPASPDGKGRSGAGPGVQSESAAAEAAEPQSGTRPAGEGPPAQATGAAPPDASASVAAEDGKAASPNGEAGRSGAASGSGRAPAAGRAGAGGGRAGGASPRLSKRELKKQKAEERKIKAFRDYFDFSDDVRKIPPHRVLALNRGERAKVLRVKIEADVRAMHNVLDEVLVPAEHPHAEFLRGCARDALTRLIWPSLERELRRELTDRAEVHAVGVFAKNLRNLLLQPPVRAHRVLAVDPGLRSGCKLAALDQFGNVLGHEVIYLVGRAERRQQARDKTRELIRRFDLTVVAIGNGTGCRQAEDFFGRLIEEDELKSRSVAYVIVNEAGASVYSTSRMGREEFPHYDAALRGAISIGRRLLDPLSELVKIDPPNIGVGLYQHDMKARHLRASLDEVVESCVNYVGVDVNTASPALLRCVSGLNQLTARRLFEHRRRHGPFRSREQLREVPGVGEATYVQAAGFLKITGGSNPLDATWIHPESYAVAASVLEKLGCTPADLARREAAEALTQRTAEVDAAALAAELDVGIHTLRHILAQLARPGRDPREDLPPPVFKHGILKLEDLEPGMELTGTVLNVVDFGAFVDIGMHDCGLVHVSQLADRFVRDPHDVVAVGDVVRVWVMEVDRQRRRVSLTMIPPGTERARRPRRQARPAPEKPRGEASAGKGRGGRPAASTTPSPRHRRAGKHKPPTRPPRKRGGTKRSRRPVRPITEAMIEGKEPLRTFGDLLQLYEHKRRAEAQESSQQQPAQQTPAQQPPAQETSPEQPRQETPAEPQPAQQAPAEQQPAQEPTAQRSAHQQAPPDEPAGQQPVTTDQPAAEAHDSHAAQAGGTPDAAPQADSADSTDTAASAEAAEHGHESPQTDPRGADGSPHS